MVEIIDRIRKSIPRKREKLFSEPFMYEYDATVTIMRGAIGDGNREFIESLKGEDIFFKLPRRKKPGIFFRLEGLDDNGVSQFTRMGVPVGEDDQATLSKKQIEELEPVGRLNADQIKIWGSYYGVPEQSELEAKAT